MSDIRRVVHKVISGGSGQLAAGHWENYIPFPTTSYASQTASDTAPFVIYPRPDSEITNPIARHRWAHSQMDYLIPVRVRGGGFPYMMTIDTANTDAALISTITIGQNFDSSSDPWYVRTPAATIASLSTGVDYVVSVKITDQDGNEVRAWWSFRKDDTKFIFCKLNTGANTGTGTYADPYDSCYAWAGTNTNLQTYYNYIIVYFQGTSSTTNPYQKEFNSDTNTGATLFPSQWIGIPDETPVIDLQGIQTMCGVGVDDFTFHGIYLMNGRINTSSTGQGAFFSGWSAAYDRCCIDNITMDTVSSWQTSIAENNGFISFGSTSTLRQHCVFSNFTCKNSAAGSSTEGMCLSLMGMQYSLFDNIHCTNFGTGTSGTVPFIIQNKHNMSDHTIRRIYADSTCYLIYGLICFTDSFGSFAVNLNVEVCYNTDNNAYISNISTGGCLTMPSDTALTYTQGPFYYYRNTLKGRKSIYVQTTYNANELNWKGNACDYAADLTNAGSTVIQSNNYYNCTFNADGTLTSAWLTANGVTRGTIGSEVI